MSFIFVPWFAKITNTIMRSMRKERINMKKLTINPGVKKAFGVVMAVGAGVAAIINTFAEQEKAREFDELKKTVSELTQK
jgi:hypothetical protein